MNSTQWVFILLATTLLTACASLPKTGLSSLEYSSEIYNKAPFEKHDEKAPFKSYLIKNLPYEGYGKLLIQLEAKLQTPGAQVKLQNRGEAHITVITPPEFDQVLSKKLSMADIDNLAEQMKIQEMPYKALCIGRGTARINTQDEVTYFVVVQADKLFDLRKAIQDLYVVRGGKAKDFNAEMFFPHVTLGYSKRDLHYEDGVKKDATSCIYKLQETKK